MSHFFRLNKVTDRLFSVELWVLYNRLVRFAIVGLSGVVVDLGSFYCLHQLLGWLLTLSSMLSTELAIINNFLWNDSWTFKDISSQHPLLLDRVSRFAKFNLICLVGLLLNMLIVDLLFYKFGVNEYSAKMVAITCVIVWNFGVNLKLNWQIKEPVEEENKQKGLFGKWPMLQNKQVK